MAGVLVLTIVGQIVDVGGTVTGDAVITAAESNITIGGAATTKFGTVVNSKLYSGDASNLIPRANTRAASDLGIDDIMTNAKLKAALQYTMPW